MKIEQQGQQPDHRHELSAEYAEAKGSESKAKKNQDNKKEKNKEPGKEPEEWYKSQIHHTRTIYLAQTVKLPEKLDALRAIAHVRGVRMHMRGRLDEVEAPALNANTDLGAEELVSHESDAVLSARLHWQK
ncbi:hypothetical protein BJ138DRAFT_1104884 [Hygrophoropsis aurantiaca]|uniref:Uncharacterized protein n=1 Tax=Hygrophoropsis aurantiaca TaxID=72124 RepID=A0ACB8A293_9AGAM|nr:hypothetical protein BJ138DRAFT_1104884 [Hygrophoropsis aurantiaca]